MFLGVVCVFSALGLFGYNYKQDQEMKNASYSLLTEVKAKTNSSIDSEYLGSIQIPALSVELPIYNDWDYTKLATSPCRYHGSFEDSNLVIMAHNAYAHFGRIQNLSSGDVIYITDMDNIVHTYKVETIEILGPYDVDPMVNSEYDLTLFCCTFDARNRVTVRCMEE